MTTRSIVGTAGHIDHGKTSLVRVLTGIDTDRLPEEKARGITIELGFAHLEVQGLDVGVVDVPGHERFVRAMVAGATGIDVVMLVVASDEGVMPQTREHLDICGLLGIGRGFVALTKADLVEPEWLALVTEDVRRSLRATFLDGAAIVPCSSASGSGIEDVRAEIGRLCGAAVARPVEGPLRLPLDRVFSLKGFGTVVTGTMATGHLAEGDEVRSVPGGATAKVRGVQVHGAHRSHAQAGERAAANLQGVARTAVSRGEVLIRPGEIEAGSVLDVELRVLPVCPAPLKTRAKLLFHALTTQESATLILLEGNSVAPGATTVAQVHLDRPVALLPGDRFILRGFRPLPGYGSTIAGGRVVRVRARRIRRADGDRAALVRRMAAASPDQRLALEIEAAGRDGIDRVGLRARLGEGSRLIERTVEALLARRAVLKLARDTGAVIAATALEAVKREVAEAVDAFHAASPLAPGIDREELRGRLDTRLFALVLAELGRDGFEVEHDVVRRKGFSARKAEAAIDTLTAQVVEIYRGAGLAPPWTSELAARARASERDLEGALDVAIRRGDVIRVKPDLCFDRAAVDLLRERLRAELIRAGQITPQAWKDLTGQSRKYAIPLAEHFDAEKVTIRVGEVRKLRGR